MDRFLVLCSTDDASSASPAEFRVCLPPTDAIFNSRAGADYEVALTQLICLNLAASSKAAIPSAESQMVYVTCELVVTALTSSGSLPLLYVTTVEDLRKRLPITQPYYIPLACDRIQDITLRLLTSPTTNQLVRFHPLRGHTVAVLHLRPRRR